MRRIFALMVTTLLISACAQAPNQSQFNSAYFGRPVQQNECQAIATQTINSRLKDPMSAQYTFRDCIKGWVASVPVMGFPIEYGYLQRGTVNARNSFGGYTGAKPYYVLIVDGRPIRAATQDNEGLMLPWRPSPGIATYQTTETTSAPTKGSASVEAASQQQVPRLTGDYLYSAEKVASAHDCSIDTKLKDELNTEIYNASCPEGKALVIHCSWGNCQGL